ncbi:MAG: alpha/beta hydrolase family esterase [Bacteriovoracaceae bacterium]
MIKTIIFFIAPLILTSPLSASTVLAPKGNRPKAIIVFLHGCKMDGKAFAKLTGIEKEIEKENIVAFFPSQNSSNNSDHCWNWFLPVNQSRFISFEHFSIFSEMQELQKKYGLTAEQTYLTGLSSGAAYAMNLMSCFPEKFNGLAIHSGLSYLAATDIFYANQALIQGPQFNAVMTAQAAYKCGGFFHRPKKTLLIHGKADVRVNPKNFFETTEHFVHLNDYFDDGYRNNSFPTIVSTKTISPQGRYSYQESRYTSAGKEILRTLFIDQLQHKWSGGSVNETYADSSGPNINHIMLDYFLK